MSDVYRAPKPSPEYQPHQCDYPGTYDPERPIGSIWRCGSCGQYWYKYSMRGIEWTGAPGRNWEKVRWWNWRYKRIISRQIRVTKEEHIR